MSDAIHFVDANGLKFAYLEEGSGPLVLLLHGFPDTAHSWDDLRPRIAAKGYRAVSPFMRGYHPSGIPDRDPDQETLARDPLALIDALMRLTPSSSGMTGERRRPIARLRSTRIG
jgi:pimeloyl-ACP methyl ester carboxylesterase